MCCWRKCAAVKLGWVCRRYSAVIDDNTITHLNVEPDGSGLSCSLADVVLKQLQEA